LGLQWVKQRSDHTQNVKWDIFTDEATSNKEHRFALVPVTWITEQVEMGREGKCQSCDARSTGAKPLVSHTTKIKIEERAALSDEKWYCDKCWTINKNGCKPNNFSEIGVLDLKCGGRRALHLAESGLAVSHTEFNSSGINNAGGLHSSLLG
jgi:hypothetical protein